MTEMEQLVLDQQNSEDLLRRAEICRVEHERKTFDTTPVPDVIDYGACGQVASLAMAHLNESIPNGQRERTEAAFQALTKSVKLYGLWLRKKGLLV